MALSPEEQRLRDQFFKTLLETALRLQPGADPEVTLEALLDASQMLQEHLARELDALRREQAE
jgi:CRISPR/Cas system-associated protein Csm6